MKPVPVTHMLAPTRPLVGVDELIVSGLVSTVHVCSAGVRSALRARSVARTRTVCEPSAGPACDDEDVQPVQLPAEIELSSS
jgi:hypothetical protein